MIRGWKWLIIIVNKKTYSFFFYKEDFCIVEAVIIIIFNNTRIVTNRIYSRSILTLIIPRLIPALYFFITIRFIYDRYERPNYTRKAQPREPDRPSSTGEPTPTLSPFATNSGLVRHTGAASIINALPRNRARSLVRGALQHPHTYTENYPRQSRSIARKIRCHLLLLFTVRGRELEIYSNAIAMTTTTIAAIYVHVYIKGNPAPIDFILAGRLCGAHTLSRSHICSIYIYTDTQRRKCRTARAHTAVYYEDSHKHTDTESGV